MSDNAINQAMSSSVPVFTERPFSARNGGVSWAAVFAGAAVAAALSMILVVLGLGLGFSVISPWPAAGVSAAAVGISTAVWLAGTQIVASGLGGYLSGRLRVGWTDVHSDEVHFRDTAHGLLSWAIASLATAALLSSALTGFAATGARVAGDAAVSMASVAQSSGRDNESGSYLVDAMFRSNDEHAGGNDAPLKAEASAIVLRAMASGTLDPSDRTYLGKLVAQRTGLSQTDAEKRINDLYTQGLKALDEAKTKAKQAADSARKAAAAAALWMFIALLCGAFCASVAAIWGGRQRDSAVVRLA